MTAVLKQFHSLSVKYRFEHKLLVMVFHALHVHRFTNRAVRAYILQIARC